MTDMKQPATENRTRLRLGEIERLIRKNRLIVPVPSRRALLNMCEEGVLETAGNAPTRLGWLVYEDSFWAWVRSIDGGTDE
ncbi:MAG: hypothetical protein QUS14_08375 [Pyrinomonadaceae bacterium]|nr:hypothetical protein [Pyrinomonadaceae bacterium]